MELRVLRYFLTTVKEGNITRAANLLHVTQPTLSRQLIELELELGTTLLIRGKRSLTLTDDGFFFKQQAEEIVTLADRAERIFLDKKDSIRGVITVGATETKGGRILADYIFEFQQKYPDVQFDLHNKMADNVKEDIEKGLIDVGIVLEPVDTSRFEFIRLNEKETWGILMRKDHPLAEKESINVEDIKCYPLILPGRENAKNKVLHWLRCEESDLQVPAKYDILSNTALLVEKGVGCAICLDGALSISSSPDLCFRPVRPEHTTRSVILWKKNHIKHPAASLFIQMLQSQSEKIENEK